jgi:hypothetical protein
MNKTPMLSTPLALANTNKPDDLVASAQSQCRQDRQGRGFGSQNARTQGHGHKACGQGLRFFGWRKATFRAAEQSDRGLPLNGIIQWARAF